MNKYNIEQRTNYWFKTMIPLLLSFQPKDRNFLSLLKLLCAESNVCYKKRINDNQRRSANTISIVDMVVIESIKKLNNKQYYIITQNYCKYRNVESIEKLKNEKFKINEFEYYCILNKIYSIIIKNINKDFYGNEINISKEEILHYKKEFKKYKNQLK